MKDLKEVLALALRKASADVSFAQHGSGQTHFQSERYDPYKGFKFLVEISGNANFTRAGFQKVTGLSMDTDVVEYREGGDNLTVSKSPGLTKFENLVFTRGMSNDHDAWDWASLVYDNNDLMQEEVFYRSNIIITLHGRDNKPLRRWEVPNAWLAKYQISEFNAEESGVAIETMEIAHEGFTEIPIK